MSLTAIKMSIDSSNLSRKCKETKHSTFSFYFMNLLLLLHPTANRSNIMMEQSIEQDNKNVITKPKQTKINFFTEKRKNDDDEILCLGFSTHKE